MSLCFDEHFRQASFEVPLLPFTFHYSLFTFYFSLFTITEPSTGRVTIKGRVASLLEVGTGFHPKLTGRAGRFRYDELEKSWNSDESE